MGEGVWLGGGESRSMGSPGRSRSGRGEAGLGGWGLCIGELKCTQVHFSCRRVCVCVYIHIYIFIYMYMYIYI
jgi:hypothetical protein